ncbi:SsgA family sporulation/cell division regulator [Streptomyces sp. NBC_00893]|uniref:SsgA family sporulation/cell division regulator n=1 Tax=Streptomyces sp. NBC_00893 TaxID=2975862 RepID=UPI0022535240|nr:SsgA family sporulation/cell division regulator [Streptomyces sp. NBC_00893]MCX4847451.1 SsgA family sporulation/cell division regulator [Streptomyces sp. NBC_00893]
MPPVIQEQADAWLVNDTPDLPAVPVDLLYDADKDPRTVRIAFPGGADWAFGRDLLEGGLRAPTERDGIRVWPCGRTQLVVENHSADGVEVVQFDSAPLIRFLHRTHTESAKPPAHA